jgi:hypothetical protein
VPDEPKTPPPVVHSEPAAEAPPAPPPKKAKKPSKQVLMVSPIGGVEEAVPRAEAKKRLREGWRSATQKELVDYKLERDYGDVASGVAAFSTGALRMLSAGYSDDAIVKIFGEGARKHIAGLRQVQGAATLGGEITGALVGAKGLGAAGRLAVPGIAARGAALPGAARLIGGGVLEGAYAGGVEAKTQALVENRELTGEALFAGTAGGALIGGAFGGVFAGGGYLLRKGKDKLASAYARRAAGKAPEDLATAGMSPTEAAKFRAGMKEPPADPGFLVRQWVDSAGTITGAPRELLEEIATSKKARQMVTVGADDAMFAAERDMTKAVNEAVEGFGVVQRHLREVKADEFAHLVPQGGIERSLPATRANFGTARRNLTEMLEGGQFQYGKQAEVKKVLGAVDELERSMEERIAKHYAAGGVPDGRLINRELYISQDKLKRLFQGRAKKLKASARRTGDPAMMASHKRYRDFSEEVRGHLEDQSLWGKAAAAQRDLNKPQTSLYGINQGFHKRFTTTFGRDVDDIWDPGVVADPQKIAGYVKGVTNPRQDLAHRALREWLDGAKQTSEAARQHLKLTPKVRAAIDKLDAAVKLADETTTQASRDAGMINAFNKLVAEEGAGGVVSGAALGGLVGGLPGAAVGAVTGTITKPGAAITKLAAAERMVGRTGRRFGIKPGAARAAAAEQGAGFTAQSATQDVVNSVGRDVGRSGGRLKRLAPVVRTVATYTELERRDRARSEKHIKSALIAAENPEQTAADVRQRLGALGAAMPGVADSAVQTAQRAAAYLADHAPQPRNRPEVLGAPAIPPTDAELERFERRRSAAVDPVRTITDGIEKGTITRESVHALDYIYPALGEKLRDSYRDTIVALADKGESLPYQTLLNLEVLMKQPLDGLSLPLTQAAIQASYAATEPPPKERPPKKPAPEMARYSIREDAGISKELA